MSDKCKDKNKKSKKKDSGKGKNCPSEVKIYTCSTEKNSGWNALDPTSDFPIYRPSEGDLMQNADQFSTIGQRSKEVIVIKDSLNVNVTSTETQVAASLQAALQVAIALVVNITIADSAQAERVTQQLLQYTNINQTNKQSVYIKNSRDVNVQMTDTDIAISLQLMLQLLLALLIEIDVL